MFELLIAETRFRRSRAPPTFVGSATPIGAPTSIAEAMVTGAHVLVRDVPPLVSYVGNAGIAYRDLDHAAKIIAATRSWTEQQWREAWLRSVDRAFFFHADDVALRPIFEDWLRILEKTRRQAELQSTMP